MSSFYLILENYKPLLHTFNFTKRNKYMCLFRIKTMAKFLMMFITTICVCVGICVIKRFSRRSLEGSGFHRKISTQSFLDSLSVLIFVSDYVVLFGDVLDPPEQSDHFFLQFFRPRRTTTDSQVQNIQY